ncbi:MAG: TatD family hydrolase [Bacteroidales bacterium]|jgi:TatD DNase family protein
MLYIQDIHTHHDYTDKTYVKSLRLNQILDNLECELDDSSNKKNKFLSLGIHPWDLSNNVTETEINQALSIIESVIKNEKIFGIGECGLDKLIDISLEYQKIIFVKQIKLSIKYDKPLIIHSVKTNNEIIELKKEFKANNLWILHGYMGNVITAKQLIKHNIYISINNAKPLTKNNIEVINNIDKKFIFFESDDVKQQ